MGVIADFNYQTWVTRYPEFSSVDASVANSYWIEAGLYHRNDGTGPVDDLNQQTLLVGMVAAHIAKLYELEDGKAKSDLVGRIGSASEGSVSVSASFDEGNPAQWYLQTKYGASYWRATAIFRTFRYHRGPQRFFGPLYGGRFIR